MRGFNRKLIGIGKNYGLSLVELLIAVTISGLIMLSINGILGLGLQSQAAIQEKNDLTRQVRFAMQRMVQTIQSSPHLLLPLVDSPSSGQNEAIHDVVAVTISRDRDLDGNGTSDADNDGDGLFDEDLPADNNNDARGGIAHIDDDKDGPADTGFSSKIDDDEDAVYSGFSILSGEDEDPINGIDDDGDGSIDEDAPADMNNDGCSGVCGVDEDGDGTADEDDSKDDDEDGQIDEDWYDSVVFYENNGFLYQRTPVPWDENSDGSVTGKDYVESVIADNVSSFTVERVVLGTKRAQLVDLTLELTNANGETVKLSTQVRVGGGL